MILFKRVILISFEQVSTESRVFSLQWERLSYSLLPHALTSTVHAHFTDSSVSVTVSSSRVTSHCWGFITVHIALWCCFCYSLSGTIKITKDMAAPFCSEQHLFPIFPLEEEGSAFLCLSQCFLSLPKIHWKYFPVSWMLLGSANMHVRRPCGTCNVHCVSQVLPHLHFPANPSL